MTGKESVLQRRIALADLLEADAFTEVVKGFVELYRVGIKVFDDRGGKLADLKVGNGDFCGFVFSFPEGRRRCTATVGRVKDGPIECSHGGRRTSFDGTEAGLHGSRMVTVPCFTGLRYLILPVLWEGDTLGRVVFGPFYPDDLRDFPPATLTEIADVFDSGKAEGLVRKIRAAPESAVARVVLHFASLLQTMLFAGQKMFLTSQLHVEATLEQNRELEVRNAKLAEANERLQELDRLKSAFLATVSHELRTPLTSIIGYSEMLAEGLTGELNQEQKDYVQTIMEKGETLLKLITSILDISQIEAGRVRLVFEPMQVGDLVTSSLSSVRPQALKKGLNVDMRLPARPPIARGDRDRLRQVFVNLLGNAVKFTPKGGTVTISLSEVAALPELGGVEGFRVTVEDTGVGISEDQFEKIFRSFYQVDSSSTREFGGAGIGLSIVRSFVEGHGGKIRVTSQLGRGSCFTVSLPLAPSSSSQSQISPPITSLSSPSDERF